jgi:serine/threonine protein kinase
VRIPQVGENFGPFLVQSQLGRGGMGAVFVASQVTLNRPVALKVLLPQYATSEDYRRRFGREASALASAQSPHIVSIFDHGEIDGALFIATQLVPGGDLGARLAGGPMGLAAALEVARHVCTALADAHAVGVLHRDVKPSNVLLWDRPEGPHAYLCDFGIAKIEGATQHTSTEGIVGTWAFLAPERCNGAPASEASDIYAAGCVLWNMVAGTTPYGGTAVEMAMAHVSRPVPQLAVSEPVHRRLNEILRRSMAKDPAERYASAAAMARDLTQARDSLAAATRDTGSSEQVTADRHRAPHTASPAHPPAGDLPSDTDTFVLTPPQRRRVGPGAAALVALVLLGLIVSAAYSRGWRPSADRLPGDGNPSAAPSSGSVRCWDARLVASIQECTTPSGAAGLAWVLPSLNPQNPECLSKGSAIDGKSTVVVCPFQFRGARGLLRYTEWDSVDSARRHYADVYPDEPREVESTASAPRLVWRLTDRSAQNRFRMSSAYVDWPFSISVEADSLAAREWGYRQVAFRTDDQMAGVIDGSN